MEIKILSFISLLPIIYTINKVIKRKDLTAIDIVILYQSLYMSIIPIIGNQENIAYPIVRFSSEIHWFVFSVYTTFIILLIFMDRILQSNYCNTIYSITKYIRYLSKYIRVTYFSLLILFIFIIYQWSVYYFNFQLKSSIIDLGDVRENIKEVNSPLTMLLNSIYLIIRLFIVFYLTVVIINLRDLNSKFKIIIFFTTLSEIIFHLLISRTYLFESISIVFLIIYSLQKDNIRFSFFLKILFSFIFAVYIIFPIITTVRAASKDLMFHKENVNVLSIIEYSYDYITSKKEIIKEKDNANERQWNVYQIIGYSYTAPYQNLSELILHSISYSLPSKLFPNKSKLGSQGIIERETKLYNDIADSILLFSVMGNRFFSPLIACVIYLIVFKVYIYIYRKVRVYTKNPYCCIIMLLAFFRFLNLIEYTMDRFINSIFVLVFWIFIINILTKKVLKQQHTELHQDYSKLQNKHID